MTNQHFMTLVINDKYIVSGVSIWVHTAYIAV